MTSPASRVLTVFRHGHAGEAPGRPDRDRPLRERGRQDLAAAATALVADGVRPDLVLCSPAVRTRETWAALAAAVDPEGVVPVSYESRLYEAYADDLVELVRETAGAVRSLLLVGHNPAVRDLVGELTGAPPDGFPAGTYAVLDVPGGWPELGAGGATLRRFRRTP